MSRQRRQIVGSAAAVLVGVGVGITTNIVTERPRTAWVVALVALTVAATAIQIGLKLSEREDNRKPEGFDRPGQSHVSTQISNGGTAYTAGRDNFVGMTTGQLIAVVAAIVIVVVVLAGVLISQGGRDDSDKSLPLPPEPGPTVQNQDSSSAPTLSPSSSPVRLPRTKVPSRLVGTWSGGTDGATANWTYTFSADGDVEQANGRIGVLRTGTVVVGKTTLTLYFPNRQPEEFRWQVSSIDAGYGYEFSNLQLDGLSYVRQDAEPSSK
jgi:hypothetical protein